MKKILLLVLLFSIAVSDNVMGSERDALAKNLMNVFGFNTMLESVREESIKMAKGQMDRVVAQIKQSNPKIDSETMKELDAANQEYIKRIVNSWSSEEASRIYSKAIVEGLPEKDMQAAIEHYRTPEGQRELKVITAAAQSMQSYISQSIQKETEAAMKDFLIRLKPIAERLKNNKDKVQIPMRNN